MPPNRVQHQKGLSDDAFEQRYPNEEACRKAWFAWRWLICGKDGAHGRALLRDAASSMDGAPSIPKPLWQTNGPI
jgi:hypothetical protein